MAPNVATAEKVYSRGVYSQSSTLSSYFHSLLQIKNLIILLPLLSHTKGEVLHILIYNLIFYFTINSRNVSLFVYINQILSFLPFIPFLLLLLQ